MKLNNLERIKILAKQANQLDKYFDKFYKKVNEEKSCDKYGAEFELTSVARFEVFAVEISFCSHKGYYGNSGCGVAGPNLIPEDAKDYFVKAINRHKEKIFDTMAEMMREDAKKITDLAKEEIRKSEELLNSLSENINHKKE